MASTKIERRHKYADISLYPHGNLDDLKKLPEYTLIYPITALLRRCRFSILQKDVDISTIKVYNAEVDYATSIHQEVIYVRPICTILSCDF